MFSVVKSFFFSSLFSLLSSLFSFLFSVLYFLFSIFRLVLTHHSNTTPSITDATLAACALLIPKNDRGLIRIISTKKRAIPVKIKYPQKITPLVFVPLLSLFAPTHARIPCGACR